MDTLRLEQRTDVMVIRLNLPGESVNKINALVKSEMEKALDKLAFDDSSRAAVLISSKPGSFIAGADIDEFVALENESEAEQMVRAGQELVNRFEESPKPVVAAIDGVCLGGGLEAALACAYRIGTSNPKTSLGLPEVQIGIIPAAGGCQRLPRLIGLRSSLDLILAGKTVDGNKAHRLGIIDEIVHPAILEKIAVERAHQLAGGWKPDRSRGGAAVVLLEKNPIGRSIVFSKARKMTASKTGGHYPAPIAAIDAIEHGLSRGIAAGLDREVEHFARLAVSDVSRKLVQIFFATTAMKKDRGTDQAVEPRSVDSIGVVGAGFMGAAIGGVAASKAGVDVRFQEPDWPRLVKGIESARRSITERRKRRRITRYEEAELHALLSGDTEWSGFGRTDLVIEAVFEDLDVKHEVFKKLESLTPDRCVLASNTSTIRIADIATAVSDPSRVIGMHFFSPVEKMPLLEVIVTDRTAPEVIATSVAFGRKMGKTVIVVRDSPGFWINRILTPYLNEAGNLLEHGVPIERIDKTIKGFGFPVGPITLMDEVGLDVIVKASTVMSRFIPERVQVLDSVKRMVDAKRLGRKSGKGFYQYHNGKRMGPSDNAQDIIGAGAKPDYPVGAIKERLIYALLNEAAHAFSEGVVRSPRDADIGAIFGMGYPPFLGGPLRYMDDLGPGNVVKTLESLADQHGDHFKPASILVQMAKANSKFYPDS